LRLRAVDPDGTAGDWIPLITLVRLPTLNDVHCPWESAQPCTVTGSGLYLVDSVATDPNFTNPTDVPEGFIGTTLSLSRPSKSGFYLRLRDDPAAANVVTIPVTIQRPPQRVSQKAAPAVAKPEVAAPATPAQDATPTEAPPTTGVTPPASVNSGPANNEPPSQSNCPQGTCPVPSPAASAPPAVPPAKS